MKSKFLFIIKKFLVFSFLIIFFSTVLFANNPTKTNPIRIVTSFSIIEYFVKKITESASVQINSIVPLESDPHTYQPTPRDSEILSKADLIFINGLDFEKGVEKMARSCGTEQKIYTVSKGIKGRQDVMDPHLWHDIDHAKAYISNITHFLSCFDPKNSRLYHKNKEKFLKDLDALKAEIINMLAHIPFKQRLVVTTHDAFWYFGKAYDIQFFAPVGISTEEEASAQNIAKLIDLIKEKNIKVVFFESLSNPKLLRQMALETGASIGGVLYADSLSKSDGPADTYESMMRYNVLTLLQAFRGNS